MALSNRRKRRGKGNAGNLIKAIALGLVTIGFVGVFFFQSQKMAAIDPETFCDRTLDAGVTAILVDASDKIETVKRATILNDLTNFIELQPVGRRIDIFITQPLGNTLPEPIFTKCNPGKPKKYDAAIKDAEQLRNRFETEFVGGLQTAIGEQLRVKEADKSPIIESIRAVAAYSFKSRLSAENHSLLVVSDMLQNTDLVSHYANKLSFDDFHNSSNWPMAIAKLDDVEIRLYYIARPGSSQIFQNRSHIGWWEDYFRESGGSVRRLDTY